MINFSKLVLLIDRNDIRLNPIPPEFEKELKRIICLKRREVFEALLYILHEDAALRGKVAVALTVLEEYRKSEGLTTKPENGNEVH